MKFKFLFFTLLVGCFFSFSSCEKDCKKEHVFGFMEQSMKGLIFRGVGMVRAKANIAMTNLVYNMCRLVQIKRYHADWTACN